MDVDKIIDYADFLKRIRSTTLDDLLKLTDENIQEYIVRVMMNSFTDPLHIQLFIDKFSPNDDIREMRDMLWKLMR